VPVVGLKTMGILEDCRAAAFVLEARKTLMLDRDDMIGRAGKKNIVLMGKT